MASHHFQHRLIQRFMVFSFNNYSQSLFRKLSIEGWKTQYLTNNLLQVWFKNIVCLALIPLDNVTQQFYILRNELLAKIYPNIGSSDNTKHQKKQLNYLPKKLILFK